MATFDNPKTQKPDPKRQIGVCCDEDDPNPLCAPKPDLAASLAARGPPAALDALAAPDASDTKATRAGLRGSVE
jgi:hypothetical protein